MMLRVDEVCREMGQRSHSAPYTSVHEGLLTAPVKLGRRSTGWPDYEIAALLAARIAGKTDDEIRALVVKLHDQRVAGSGQPFVSDFFARSVRCKQAAQGRVKRSVAAKVEA